MQKQQLLVVKLRNTFFFLNKQGHLKYNFIYQRQNMSYNQFKYKGIRMKQVLNILKQIPFWFFISLKCCMGILLVVAYFNDLFDPLITPDGYIPDWFQLFPNSGIIILPIYFVISSLLGLQIRKKSLGWATLFVSIEWIYLLVSNILFYYYNVPFSHEYIVV